MGLPNNAMKLLLAKHSRSLLQRYKELGVDTFRGMAYNVVRGVRHLRR